MLWRKKIIVSILVVSFIFITFGSSAMAGISGATYVPPDRSPATMLADVVAVRPLYLASVVAGTGLFIVSLPFSLLGQNTGEVFQKSMVEPAKIFLFKPLGHF